MDRSISSITAFFPAFRRCYRASQCQTQRILVHGDSMTIQQNRAFTELLQTWSRHQDLRDAGAPIADLAASRAVLDDARLQAVRAVRRIAA